jgi:hypothetical protein
LWNCGGSNLPWQRATVAHLAVAFRATVSTEIDMSFDVLNILETLRKLTSLGGAAAFRDPGV